MCRLQVLLVTAVVAVGISSAAPAADMPVKAPFLAPAGHSWDGFYLGLVAGGGLQNTNFDDKWLNLSVSSWNLDGSGFTAGGTAGWNYQFGSGVIGVEADFNWADFQGSFTDPQWFGYGSNHSAKWNGFATVRGRAGLAFDRVLMYATGGVAFVKLNDAATDLSGCAFSCFSLNNVQTGIAVGAGAEYAISGRWSAKAEYLYVALPSVRIHDANPTAFQAYNTHAGNSDAHIVRLGLNYNFGGTSASGTSRGSYAMASLGAPSNWTGFYVGAVAGGALQNTTIDDKNCSLSCSSQNQNGSGFTSGGTVGWNQQFGHGLLGVEADFNWDSFKGSLADTNPVEGAGFTIHSAQWNWFSTVRARAGLVANNALFYATGGVAFVDVNDYGHSLTNGCDSYGCFSIAGVQTGIAVGIGSEYALGGSWTAKGEYLYIGLPNKNTHDLIRTSTSDTYNAKSDAQMVRLGLNYHLNPIAATKDVPALMALQWSGFYVGAVAGGALQNTVLNDKYSYLSYGSQTMNGSGSTAGGTVGWNHQFGFGAVGVEADFNWANFKSNFSDSDWFGTPGVGTTHSAQWNWFSTVRARAGLVANNALFYATGGVAFVDVNDYSHSLTNGCDNNGCFSITGVQTGIAAGFGAEYVLSESWTAKGEYLYIGLPNKNTSDVVPATAQCCGPNIYGAKSEAHILRLGLNFHLN